MSTLLEKAKEVNAKPSAGIRVSRHDFDERIDLALAYIRQEITGPQAMVALGAGSITTLGTTLLTALRHGLLEIVDRRVKEETTP